MTCIVGLAHGGKVTIGGDAAGTAGHSLQLRADSKVFVSHGYLMGFTTSFRMGQLLRYAKWLPSVPTAEEDWDLDRFMATRFVSAIKDVFEDGGWLGKTGEQRHDDGTFLVGARGALYAMHDDFQIARTLDGYAAVGSGFDLALGSMYTTTCLGLTPHQRIETALRAASHHSSCVSGPFTIEEV